MKQTKKTASISPVMLWDLLSVLTCYRRAKQVEELRVFDTLWGETGYYVCPNCGITMEREYSSYCDRCGQRLGWKNCKKARIIYPGRQKELHKH